MRTLASEIGGYEGKEVSLSGWVQARRDHGKIIFIDLRDVSGLAQLVFTGGMGEELRPEWVIQVSGTVAQRPENMVNPNLASGQWEVKVTELKILSQAQTPPLPLDTPGYDIEEEVRLKYRYLDLRRPRLAKNLKVRHKVIKFIRDYLDQRGFTEVETPIISKSTPEGARDYIVPSRLHPGKFYALPQSPQQYKQLLMVAGLEKYYQIARCFRDEDTRGDRQPEHTQLDIEMSFVEPEDVMSVIETMTTAMMKELFPEKKMRAPWPRISYTEAMKKYGTDKPDIRENKNDLNEIAFAWIVDFPSFERDKTTGQIQPVHHMFVQPKEGSIPLLDKDPFSMVSTQYDWVCNGYELASGSLRITNPALQMKVFKLLGMSEEKAKNDFGHLLEAFSYGVPPHGGIAPGLDRLVMILQNEPNIREVIAFPKTGDGRDPMMKAPSEITKEQLNELWLEIKPSKKNEPSS